MRRLPDSSRFRPGDKTGSVIVLVLVLVVLLTFIVVAFLEEATGKIKYYGLFHNRDDLRTDAYSAMEITLAVINQYREIEGQLWGPAQGWADPLADFGFTPRNANEVRVTFEDESAKLPLSELDYDTLLILFDVLGFDLPERERLADGLLDWIDENDIRNLNGFDGEDYEDMDPPYRPANGPIQSWDEFRLIHPFNSLFFDESGRPNARWRRFKEAVSLYHEGSPNINQAPYTVLEVLQERGILDVRSFLDFKNGADGEPNTEDDRLLRSTETMALGEEGTGGISTGIELLRVKVAAIRGDARFELEALVSWSGSDAGAADSRSLDEDTPRTERTVDRNDQSAAGRRRLGRGSTRTAPSAAAELGYPFRFLRIAENRKF